MQNGRLSIGGNKQPKTYKGYQNQNSNYKPDETEEDKPVDNSHVIGTGTRQIKIEF